MERGGIIGGAAITIAIICFAIMVGCIAVAHNDGGHSLGQVERIRHDRDGGGDDYQGRDGDGGYSYRHGRGNNGDCQSGGCENRSRRCERSSGDCRSSFSPGPFKDSPVVICMPNSCNGQDQPGRGGQQPQESPECLLGVPYHCDRPRSPEASRAY